MNTAPPRPILLRRAFTLEWLTLGWMTIEAVVAIGAGVAAASLTLMAYGLDSIIELTSAAVLVWRLNKELRQGEEVAYRTEQLAQRIGGALLYALAAYILLSAAWAFWARHGGEFSVPGLVVAVLAMPIMYGLARQKLKVAALIGSGAMRADAVESITCGWLSLVVVVGLAARVLLGAWWVDPLTSLAIVWFVLREAHEAWTGDTCCEA